MKTAPAPRPAFVAPFFLVLVFMLLAGNPAWAGWYQIKNYQGKVGTAPVHLSLQTFEKLNGEGDTRIIGSYYYDARRIPLRLTGQRLPGGDISLCESDLVPDTLTPEKAVEPRCVFTLQASLEGLTGTWKSATKSHAVELREVGALDNNREENLRGIIEIPMWYHTEKAMFVGVYTHVGTCGKIVMSELRLIDMASGSMIKNRLLEETQKNVDYDMSCEAGLLMTGIYSNVEPGEGPGSVTIHYGGGKMGFDAIGKLPPNAFSAGSVKGSPTK